MQLLLLPILLATVTNALPQPSTAVKKELSFRIKAAHERRANAIIPVVVGGPQDTFVPNSVVAAVGDVVQFQFSNGNHTVTQSTADTACTPMEGGVHSGHIPFEDGQTEVGTFNMPVTSTDPMFLYCATGPHCQEGQVMIINPTNAEQVANYAKLSQSTTESVDGTNIVGGTPGKISLDTAAFVPAPAEEAAPPPPPAEAAVEQPPAEEAPAEQPPAEEAPPAEASASAVPTEPAPAEDPASHPTPSSPP